MVELYEGTGDLLKFYRFVRRAAKAGTAPRRCAGCSLKARATKLPDSPIGFIMGRIDGKVAVILGAAGEATWDKSSRGASLLKAPAWSWPAAPKRT